jgi:hypothetical protein
MVVLERAYKAIGFWLEILRLELLAELAQRWELPLKHIHAIIRLA